MKIVILGGSGQVGWELQRSLRPLGEVIVAPRALDLGDPARIEQMWAAYRPDALVNAAAYTAVDEAENQPERADAINHRAVATLAHLAAHHDSWLVHYSSDYVFGGQGSDPFSESDPTGPLNVYGHSKLAGDQAIVASGCRRLIFRTSWVHAPRGRNFIASILKAAAVRPDLRVVDDQHGAPTSAELIADVTAAGLERAMAEDGTSGTYHLAAAGETSWYEIARFVVAKARQQDPALKLEPQAIHPIRSSDYPTPAARPLNSRLNTGKLRDTFGVDLPEWQTGVERTLAGLVAA